MAKNSRADVRRGVHSRIRKKVRGTGERPRLAVFRSANHIYAQVIDDDSGKTLASASSNEKKLGLKSGGNIDGAVAIGKAIAERAVGAGIETVVYDRGGFLYHGRVKALLDATRQSGLNKNELEREKKEKKSKEKAPDEKETGATKKKAKPAKKESAKETKEAKAPEAPEVEKEENNDE